MTSFGRPENALRRAEELRSEERLEDAGLILYAALTNRRWRNNKQEQDSQWQVMERIAMELLEVCVDQRELQMAKDGLIAYRAMTQSMKAASLEKVTRHFRTYTENIVKKSKATATTDASEIEDLENMDNPLKAFANALKTPEEREALANRRKSVEDVRFLWECYKQILDVFKTNGKTEDLYNETAKRACDFCKDNGRVNEFKKLCDMLRNNFASLFKRKEILVHHINPNASDTIKRTLETRIKQMEVAGELKLYRESQNLAEDLHQLMNRLRKLKPQLFSQYFEFLGEICWNSEQYLFYAYACIKTYVLFKNFNTRASVGDTLGQHANMVALSALCVPERSNLEDTAFVNNEEEEEVAKLKKMATFFNAASIPTRADIKSVVGAQQILPMAIPEVRALYLLLEPEVEDVNATLLMSDQVKPLLESLEQHAHLKKFVPVLRKVAFFKVLGALSKVYMNMSVAALAKMVAPLVDFATAEKWIVFYADAFGLNVQMSYVDNCVVFNQAKDLKILKQPLAKVANLLYTGINKLTIESIDQKMTTSETGEKDLQLEQLASRMQERVLREKQDIVDRLEEITARKLNLDRESQRKAQERMADEKRRREKEKKDLEKGREENAKRRANEAKQKQEKAVDMIKMKDVLANMKLAGMTGVKVGDKLVEDLTEADLEELTSQEITGARDAHVTRERQTKVLARKNESKRVDHLARAFREQNAPKIVSHKPKEVENEKKFFEEVRQVEMDVRRGTHAKSIELKDDLTALKAFKERYMNEKLGEREAERQAKLREQRRQEWDEKCKRAIIKFEKAQKMAKEEEKRKEQESKRREEEKKMEEEEEEKRKQKATVYQPPARKYGEGRRENGADNSPMMSQDPRKGDFGGRGGGDRDDFRRGGDREEREPASDAVDNWRRGGGDDDNPRGGGGGGRDIGFGNGRGKKGGKGSSRDNGEDEEDADLKARFGFGGGSGERPKFNFANRGQGNSTRANGGGGGDNTESRGNGQDDDNPRGGGKDRGGDNRRDFGSFGRDRDGDDKGGRKGFGGGFERKGGKDKDNAPENGDAGDSLASLSRERGAGGGGAWKPKQRS